MACCPTGCDAVSWTNLVGTKAQIAALLDELRNEIATADYDCEAIARAFKRLQIVAAYGAALASRCSIPEHPAPGA